jgi:hypothetical protein
MGYFDCTHRFLHTLVVLWVTADYFMAPALVTKTEAVLLRACKCTLRQLNKSDNTQFAAESRAVIDAVYEAYKHPDQAIPCQKVLAALLHEGRYKLGESEWYRNLINDIPKVALDILRIANGWDESPLFEAAAPEEALPEAAATDYPTSWSQAPIAYTW